jgi:uncharacterized cupin superfamily protein
VIAHWDDVAADDDLAQAAGAIDVSVRRVELAAGAEAAPYRPGTEEIVYIVSGSGWSGEQPVRAADVVVRPVPHEAETLSAGDDSLTALIFATPAQPPPFHSGEPEPSRVLNLDAAESSYEGEAGRWVRFARQAGAVHAGVNYGHLEGGHAGAPPHCHSADEELFVMLEGEGTLELWPSPALVADGMEREQHEIRAGHVISRPPSSAISHSMLAGMAGLTFLAYGTRRPNDVCYYPRSNKIYWRGLGLIARLEPLDYDDGEPED